MRKDRFFLVIVFLLIYPVIIFPQGGKTITIATYYPSPCGVYRILRLYPTTDINPINPCTNKGEIFYYDLDDTIYFCDGSNWQPLAVGGSEFWTLSGNNLYPNDTAWRVGIGLTNPNNTIQVANLINFDDSIRSTFLGTNAGRNNTGTDNTFIGYHAGYNNTGDCNTFIGVEAGYNNRDSYNTFVGHRAGYHNTNGVSNTFVGYMSGYLNTTGDYNTFLGQAAGRNNTTGSHNTFVGEAAGYWNSTGNNNTFVGQEAGRGNTSGFSNTFIGQNAGSSNTTGRFNTLIGCNADVSSGDLQNATAIGYGAVVDDSNKVRIGNDSVTWIGGAVDWSVASDERLKEDIRDCDLGLSFIMKLRPRVFRKKNGNGKLDYGFIAQEVEKALEGRETNIAVSYTHLTLPTTERV